VSASATKSTKRPHLRLQTGLKYAKLADKTLNHVASAREEGGVHEEDREGENRGGVTKAAEPVSVTYRDCDLIWRPDANEKILKI
jgi:hypothetical protein